jgi:CBS domain-containing protein
MLAHETLAASLMTRGVKTVYSDSNVAKAVDMMVRNNIGCVVVVDSSGPVGIFTERDLLSKALRQKEPLEYQMIMEVMSRPVIAVDPDKTLDQVAQSMIANKSNLTVFEGGDLVGIITATDIVREIHRLEKNFDIRRFVTSRVEMIHANMDVGLVIEEMDEKRIGSVVIGKDSELSGIFTERDLLKKVLAPKISLDTPVGDLASSPLITAPFGIDGREAARIMVARKIKRLPLLKENKLAGIITARDLVAALASSL